MKQRLLFLINSLNPGGAERQLCELVRNMDLTRFDVHLVVFYDSPPGQDFLRLQVAAMPHVTLTSLHKRRGVVGWFAALSRLLHLVMRTRPNLLHGYMEGNLPVLFLGLLFSKPVVWGIRRTSQDWSKLDRLSLWLIRVMAKVSPKVDLVIFNSEAGLRNHVAMGMKSPRMAVVPNGFDVARFKPDAALGAAYRADIGIPREVPLIGIVGRLDPVKDHATFLRAAAKVTDEWPDARFVCAGGGQPPFKRNLQVLAASLGIQHRVLWVGPCENMTAVYNALSILVVSSIDEGFPNVLGEAMACGIPCVTTGVGDASLLVGETGIVVNSRDDEAMAEAIATLLRESAGERASRAKAARLRICTTFSGEALARNTERLLLSLLPEGFLASAPPKGPATAGEPIRGPRYLLRFDDICPTMDWSVWDEVERLLVDADVKPILAVIPDNQDPKLMVDPPNPDFWERVRRWQARGWCIGLHGYQHTYVNQNPGILRVNMRSEFAGLGYDEQIEKLQKGLAIFEREGIRPGVWVAPGHSFDWTTVSALKAVGMRAISDGVAFSPYRGGQGLTWIPQVFAHMRPLPFGVTTFCYHLEDLTPSSVILFQKRLKQLGPRMISFQEAERMGNRSRSASDILLALARSSVYGVRRFMRANIA